MCARSSDLRTWQKDPDFLFFAPPHYEKDDWRDPFVFWNEDAGEYWMLLAARKTTGPARQRGCVALAVSADLETWQVREPFWAPDLYFTHECPDLFRIGAWWYLVYSTFSERTVTHYRMSRSVSGPWLAPPDDVFDGRAYYAAKTAGSDEGRRFSFGWLPTREGETDSGAWQWGGDLVVHEIAQQADGTLSVRAPQAVLDAFTQPVPLAPKPQMGAWNLEKDAVASSSTARFSSLAFGVLPVTGLIETSISFSTGTVSCGLLLRVGEDGDNYYQVRLEPNNGRIVFDRWPRPGDQPFMIERPLALSTACLVTLRVIVDGTCVVVYANDRVALSCRMYDHHDGAWGVFVAEGEARFEAISMRTT